MSDLVKVEITIIKGDWQWMGKLSKKSLKMVTQIADLMSDADVEEDLRENGDDRPY